MQAHDVKNYSQFGPSVPQSASLLETKKIWKEEAEIEKNKNVDFFYVHT